MNDKCLKKKLAMTIIANKYIIFSWLRNGDPGIMPNMGYQWNQITFQYNGLKLKKKKAVNIIMHKHRL